MHWIPTGILFVAIGAPTAALILDRIKDYPAPRFFKTQGAIALAVFIAAFIAGTTARTGDAPHIDGDDIGGAVT